MTNPTMALAELAEKGADVDVLRQMVQFMAERLMEIDVDGRNSQPQFSASRVSRALATQARPAANSESGPARRGW